MSGKHTEESDLSRQLDVLGAKIDRVVAEKAELLATLRNVRAWLADPRVSSVDGAESAERAVGFAIAKATGGES